MNTPITSTPQDLAEHQTLMEAWERMDVHMFSTGVLGAPYDDVQKILYPNPPYKAFLMAKRSGGFRVIREPRYRLKVLQEKVLAYLYERAGTPKPCAHAFIKERSIVSNARKHLERRPTFVLNLDLEAFFPSINFYRVRGVLKKAPFGFSHQVATVLAQMCVVGNELPQGAPTSPFLSNQVCRSLDRDLMDLAKRHQATYTRYADDITFSFTRATAATLPANICTFDSGEVKLGNELVGIIERHNFKVNPTKTRMSTRRRRMEVTGIVINEFPNVKRSFIDRIRGVLHAWEKYGYEAAQTKWEERVALGASLAYEKRPWKRQTRTGKPPALKNVLWGRLLYVRMVRGADDAIYTRLAERYNRLVQAECVMNENFQASTLPVEMIVRNGDDVARAVFVLHWSGNFKPPEGQNVGMMGGQGTVFAYKRHNRLITCQHALVDTTVIRETVDGPEGQVITETLYKADVTSPHLEDLAVVAINPVNGREWPLRVMHMDRGRDLALLEFVGEPPEHRHFSGMDSPITTHASGRLIGFPNWSHGRRVNVEPAVVTNRYPRSALQRFEINSLIRKGTSGGPMVDELFRVAGVAQQGATQANGNNECLCVAELDAWIAAYEASLLPVPAPVAIAPAPAGPV
ncbi:reverse transcriptase domain-containing protein [Paraburkholderia sp. GAS42]|uniref:reverse transcriptase domain-containing protein n=1 Tax=Paraburkholderia sp. GAS42 TaxID=3035135 RepID=UPI003D241D5E